ncbi:hypothetical protein [Archangium gephyra]|uniref:hypothetical protein n=1 Tax=Archangium gephyra TaxID=48 RepID=UPI001B803F9B|nr:hypothetical protein [Archangium gephyra]
MKLWKIGWMLAVVGVVMAGCPIDIGPDDTCAQDADCGAGQQCEQATGRCVARADGGSDGGGEDGGRDGGGSDGGVDGGRDGGGEDGGSDGGGGVDGGGEDGGVDRNLSCTDDSNCLAAELCHPTSKVCVRTCASAADCPDSAKTCDALSGFDTRLVCKCSTDTLCNIDRGTSDLVCSNPDKVCTPKCTKDTDCASGLICETATGQCQRWGGTGAPCSGEGQSTCDYGTHFCSTGQCTPLPAPICDNYLNFTNKGDLGTTGPILYNARLVSAVTDTSYCGTTTTPKRVKIALSAYSSRPFPMTAGEVNGFFYVRVNGTVLSASTLMMSSGNYIVSGTNRERAELTVSLCHPSSATSVSTGFYFTQGNFLCHQANF